MEKSVSLLIFENLLLSKKKKHWLITRHQRLVRQPCHKQTVTYHCAIPPVQWGVPRHSDTTLRAAHPHIPCHPGWTQGLLCRESSLSRRDCPGWRKRWRCRDPAPRESTIRLSPYPRCTGHDRLANVSICATRWLMAGEAMYAQTAVASSGSQKVVVEKCFQNGRCLETLRSKRKRK